MHYNSYRDKLKLYISKNVFQPTGTSELLIKNSINYIKNKKKFLDLGCGSGIIGISIARKIKNKNEVKKWIKKEKIIEYLESSKV